MGFVKSRHTTCDALQAHNVLLSDVAESRKRVEQLEIDLADLSERMLRGVAIRYGKNSIEYDKAGGPAVTGSSAANSGLWQRLE